MSKYTTEVRFICENIAGLGTSTGYNGIDIILEKAAPQIFSFNFPIFDEEYRLPLEKKILKHYYTSEIGLETVGLWRTFLDARMNEIMPYYNQLYQSQLLSFDPLNDVNLTTKHTLEGSGTKTGTASGSVTDDDTKKTSRTDSTAKNTSSDGTVNMTGEGTSSISKTGKDTTENTETDTTTSTTERTTSQEAKSITDSDGTLKDTAETNTENSGKSSSDSLDMYTDTPQGSIENLEAKKYVTNARKISDSAENSGKGKETAVKTSATTEDTTVTDTSSGTDKLSVEGKDNISQKKTTETEGTDKGNTTKHEYKTTTGTEKQDGSLQSDVSVTEKKERKSTDTTKTEDSTKQEFSETVTGKRGTSSFAKLLKEYRETFLNIDKMIIDDLSDLFMSIW